MKVIRTILAGVALGIMIPGAAIADEARGAPLDGQSFDGKLKVAAGFFRWIRVNDTISFKDGNFSWASGVGGGYKPTPYEAVVIEGKTHFTVRSAREEGDYVDWTGVYDGESLTELKAVWVRTERDFVHDLLLPSSVRFIFIQTPTRQRR